MNRAGPFLPGPAAAGDLLLIVSTLTVRLSMRPDRGPVRRNKVHEREKQ
jgi:hypothetical protein